MFTFLPGLVWGFVCSRSRKGPNSLVEKESTCISSLPIKSHGSPRRNDLNLGGCMPRPCKDFVQVFGR